MEEDLTFSQIIDGLSAPIATTTRCDLLRSLADLAKGQIHVESRMEAAYQETWKL
jgi:hypothetical protein